MPDLIAQGPGNGDRWRRELPSSTSGAQVLIGRSGADWNCPWDEMISRSHVRVRTERGDRVSISCLATARNPVFYRGEKISTATLVPGEHFVIGKTTFTIVNRPGFAAPTSQGQITEHAYDYQALRHDRFRDTASRIEMLSRLPDLITRSGSDEELLVRLTRMLMQATPSALAVAVVEVENYFQSHLLTSENAEINLLHYDSRAFGIDGSADVSPPVSMRLVTRAVGSRESVLHLWSGHRHETGTYTAADGYDWAFCVPLRHEPCAGWAIYVAGQLPNCEVEMLKTSFQSAPDDLRDDVKFAELVGTMIANLRQSLHLERRQAAMRHFFAPVVMESLAKQDTDQVLEPRETELSVMFCDLRGFSLRSEQHDGPLLQLLRRVSDALGVITGHILDTGGVIGDFHGDAVMGFWGWPLYQDDTARRAIGAAMRILTEIHQTTASDSFRFGIGIATGPAVAGRIGTVDQVKVTAFGPVVNLASRLEGMTKAFGTEIIVDAPTVGIMGNLADSVRVRRLARVRPAGMRTAVDAYQVLGPTSTDHHSLTDQQIIQYEQALEALLNGDWDQAVDRLQSVPSWDRPKQVLLETIMRHNQQPPENWTGVIDVPKF